MRSLGVLPPDAPDPRDATSARLRTLSFPVMGLAPQRTIEDDGAIGFTEGSGGDGGVWHVAVSVGYALWRNPDDRDDPVNLADLDERTRASLEEEPPWPRPAWLVEAAQRMRYRRLWETVRTSWHRDRDERTTLERQLVDHVNYVLMNSFREELGLQPGPLTDRAWMVSETSVRRGVTLVVDGDAHDACEIDTDPFVYAIGARLSDELVVTVVVPRDDLHHVRIALVTRDRPGR
ncbi:hypothetical protein [Microbacterium sp. No. 7]|uniref:hypothetical protein n=1 Tax=Microbacterium sp. No. 7 TaxID=1714373 RepID=UPI0012E31267|nr:hypothetical protein [Microbacterium sp. No. 7]